MSDEIIIKLDNKPSVGWVCPKCYGMRYLKDGAMSISQSEICFTPSTKCYVCNGKGRVLVTPIPDDQS